MFPQEAEWVAATLAELPCDALSPLVDIGSSDLAFRTEQQLWIGERIFRPLAERDVIMYFCDLKDAPGVDIVADLLTEHGLDRLQSLAPKVVLCCNVLEHVADAALFAERLGRLVEPGGRIVLTVPHRYPEHNDPIDTLFRPGVDELAALFADFGVERSAIIQPGSYRDEFARRPLTLTSRHLLRLPVPFLSWRKWKRSVGKLRYLVGHYEVTCISLLKG